MTCTYDCIVIGVGGMGSAALYHLARRGMTVLGIEQFALGHDRGSSHGRTRLIRKSYFEHPDYVPLLHRAYALWDDLEQAAGARLYHRTGLLLIGAPSGGVIAGVRRAARAHDLHIEDLNPEERARRFPLFAVGSDMEATFEADAGYLDVEACVRTHAEQAAAAGAELVVGEAVRGWQRAGAGIRVRTDRETYHAGRMVLCGGAWTPQLLGGLKLPLEIRRKVLLWYQAPEAYRAEAGCPVFAFEIRGRFFYGFPVVDDWGLKVGEHTGGEVVVDPGRCNRSVGPGDREEVEQFLAAHLPAVKRRPHRHCTCLYTMTPDEHFILDRHPDCDKVVLAGGFSGHGFKFAPVIGSIVADLVVHGRTSAPIGFLSASRAALLASGT